MNLEKRLYFFVPYQLTGVQKGIQAGHAALEYVHKHGKTEEFIDFIENWKTWIILNGGTTNSTRNFDGISQGSLNQIRDSLLEHKINFSYFEEPDLNNALTAICFLADERVWNVKDYPGFLDYILKIKMYPDALYAENEMVSVISKENKFKEIFPEYYNEWVQFIGGEKNSFLRDLIKDKKLA
jgi:hypothetical protein